MGMVGPKHVMTNDHDLKRGLGPGSATILVIANMIGTGIFTTSGFIMEALRDPLAMLICWIIGGIFALSGALCYGELGAMFPRAGGEYVFLRESFGKWMAFLSGWISLIVGFSAPIAAASIAFAGYFFRSVPNGLAQKPDIPFFDAGVISFSPVTVLAVGIILIFSLIHSYSLLFGSRVQNVLTIFKIAVILAFIVAGMSSGAGSFENFGTGFSPGLIFSGSFATSLIFISFAYSGWNAAAYLGGEIKEPATSIPFALITGTLIVAALYLLLNMTFIYALPMNEMSGVMEVGAKSAFSLFGGRVGRVFSLAVTLCLLSVISAMIMAGPRVYYAMAKDRTFFGLFARVSKTRKTPGPSILLQAAIAIGMVFTSSFDKLLLYIGFTLSLFAVLTVAGMMLLRVKKPLLERPYKTVGYPITPILFISGNLWIIVFCIKGYPMVTLYAAVTIIIGSVVYGYFAKKYKKAS
jgi:APA family basic amino acid/polyamine antiporter